MTDCSKKAAKLQRLYIVTATCVLRFMEAKSLHMKIMKKRKSRTLDFKKEIISNLKKIKGGLMPVRSGDTALCMSIETECQL